MLRFISLCLMLHLSGMMGLEKLGTSFHFKLPSYMEENYIPLDKENHIARWLWVSDPTAVEFLYIHEDKSPFNYNEAFIGEKYLSPLQLQTFVSTYKQKIFTGKESILETQEFLDPQQTRLLVHWLPQGYQIPVQRLSLFQKGIFGGIFVFSFVANHSHFDKEKFDSWKEALKRSRITYQLR